MSTAISSVSLVSPGLDLPDIQRRTANAVRGLAMDAVQAAGSGHPGMPMGMADAAVVLWTEVLKHDPADPAWPDRDRFVLSAGHGSMLLYGLLHLCGYGVSLDDLKAFRRWGSRTPGHPELGVTPGVETTTGPLGQGISNAVGMAIAEREMGARFNRDQSTIVDHRTYVIASDGDLMEGVSHEACALAGHLGLGKLIVLWDDNGITIDGPTRLTFTEDVLGRFTSYGWGVARVDGHDPEQVREALRRAGADPHRPSLIACRTHIGFGSPNRQDSNKAHGEPLGADEVFLTKRALDWPEAPAFHVPPEIYDFVRQATARGRAEHTAWCSRYAAFAAACPDLAAEFERVTRDTLPEGWDRDLPQFADGKPIATRAASGAVLSALASRLPELLGGSADLSTSTNTRTKDMAVLTRDAVGGSYLPYGVREHGMAALMNGMALHGGVRPYGGTFLVFSDYMRPAIRLSALMRLPVVYVFTHDSIGLGEDGPTHQPIEHLAALRATPNLVVFRPADAAETVIGWRVALQRKHGPTALVLTRQTVPVLERRSEAGSSDGAERGAYVLWESSAPDVILIGTGSEVHVALDAARTLAGGGVGVRVVSMPSSELFDEQPSQYRDQVLPPAVSARVSVEAAATFGWDRYVGSGGIAIGIDHFGASAPAPVLSREFGITAEAVIAAARRLLVAQVGPGEAATRRWTEESE